MYNSSNLKVKRLYKIFFFCFFFPYLIYTNCVAEYLFGEVSLTKVLKCMVYIHIYIYRRIDQIHYLKVGVALFLPLLTNKKWFPFPPPLPKAKELCRIKKKTDTHSRPLCPLPFARYPAGCPK